MDLARAEASGLRDLRMVMAELLQSSLPGGADDFPWPVLIHDGSQIFHVNPACLRWFGCSGDGELIGRSLERLSSPEDRAALLAALGASGPAPPTPHIQRFRKSDGTPLVGRALSRVHDVGRAPKTVVLVEPGSSTGRSFELLRLLGEAVDHLTDIVFITEAHAIDDVGRRIVFVNRAFTQSSGFEASEVLGKTPSVTVGAGTDRQALARLEAALRETRPVREDLLKYAKNGTPYWVELQIIPVFDESGEHSNWVSIQRDITQRKRLEARLLESARWASAGLLSASLASELNNPLASVVSSLQWLSERLPTLLGQLGDAAKGDVSQVMEALADAEAGAARVAEATSYLPLLAGGATACNDPHAVPLAETLDAAVLEVERQLGKELSLQRHYSPGVVVTADAGRLTHALRLTVLNAALASTHASSITLRLSTVGDRAKVTIEDSGGGIAEHMAGSLQLPFGTHKPRGIGDALALFVASRLVAELEGELVLLPAIGGTRVEIRLPSGR